MNIAATAVSMDAARTHTEVEQRFTGWGMGPAPAGTAGQTDLFGVRLATMLASATQTTLTCRSEVSRAGCGPYPGSETTLAQLTAQIIGQPVRISAAETGPSPSPPPAAVSPLSGARTISLISGVVYSQEESLLYAAQGTVRTTDGREIAFDLGLALERRTVGATTAALEAAPLFIDPLILQFDLNAPLLGDRTFLFDLDSDGAEENLACPGGGCGFLALDRNRDGRITDGLELFGPESGSGFGELAALDKDANLWIDEGDPAFDQLLIWSPDGQGGESLRSLREAGVGAIAVTHAGTGFQLERADGSIMGTITASGIFLTESGEVRPLQEVDLALPGTQQPATGWNGEGIGRQLAAALHALREIIGMQRLRLQMLLTGERLRSAMAAREEQHQLLFTWLRSRNEWQARIEDRLGEGSGAEPEGLLTSHPRQHHPAAAERAG